MDKIKFPILFTTLVMVVINMLPVLGVSYTLVATFFLITPVVLFWMVYKVLKDAEHGGQTFDEYWYEDFERDQAN